MRRCFQKGQQSGIILRVPYTNDKLIGYVDNGVYNNILYCAVDKANGTLEVVIDDGIAISKQDIPYSICVDENDTSVYTDSNIQNAVDYEVINADENYDMYMGLLNSVFWNFHNENPNYSYIEEDFYPQDENNINSLTVGSSSESIIASGTSEAVGDFNNSVNVYFGENCLKNIGCYTGYAYDNKYQKIGYYNVQTFLQNGELVSLIAVWDLGMTVIDRKDDENKQAKNVISSLKKSFNLCTTGYNSSNNTINVSRASENSTYVITKDAKIAMVLIGSQNYSYINDIEFRRAEGGNSREPSPISERIGNALVKKLLPEKVINTFSAIKDICTEIGNLTYKSGTYYIDNTDEYHKAIKNDYDGVTYKLFSIFEIRANIKNIPVLGQAVAQYEMEIASCQADNSTHTVTIRIQKSIAS